jgi:hypothetical protein
MLRVLQSGIVVAALLLSFVVGVRPIVAQTNASYSASLSPRNTTASAQAFTLTLTGIPYSPGLSVTFNNQPIRITSTSANGFAVAVPGALNNVGGIFPLTVSSSGTIIYPSFYLIISASDSSNSGISRPAISIVDPGFVPSINRFVTVTIFGDNFVTGATVSFNSSTGEIISLTSTQIVARIYISNYPDFLIVTNPNGQFASVIFPRSINSVVTTPYRINVSPNPTTDRLTTQYTLPTFSLVKTTCTNTLGQVMFTRETQHAAGQITEEFDVNALSQGVYFLQFTSNGDVWQTMFVKN